MKKLTRFPGLVSNTTENVLIGYVFRGKVEDFGAVNIVVPFFDVKGNSKYKRKY
jgi:hypothetical protein